MNRIRLMLAMEMICRFLADSSSQRQLPAEHCSHVEVQAQIALTETPGSASQCLLLPIPELRHPAEAVC